MTFTENHRKEALINAGSENWELVSVIIPVYNDYERLKLCLAALERQTYPRERFEIIVVDNGSEEKFCLDMKKYSKVIFCNEEEPGSYNARNRGIFISRGEILAFTDSDCLPDKDWIFKGVMELRTSYNIGLVGGAIDFLFKDPERPSVWELYDSITYLQQQKSIEVFKFAATANMFTTKKVFERVGLFDSRLKSGGDREWGERVTTAGYEFKFASHAIVSHPARLTFQELIKRDIRIFGGSHQLRSRKSVAERVIDLWLNILKDLCPPVRFGYRVLRDPRVPGKKNKIPVILVHVLVKLNRAWTRLRYQMGAKPTRS